MNPLEEITHAARRRGFFVYPAPPELPRAEKAAFRSWLAGGAHAGMTWLERDVAQRLEPRRRFPWLRGVLVLAAPYASEPPPKPLGGLRLGKVARYAWVRDYHLWIEPRLRELEKLCQKLGGECRGYVDHGPVLERAYAALSGAGWLGRNGLWLTEQAGSYQYLAVLLTSWPVEPKAPHPYRCGSCRACVQNCPTKAIGPGGLVDARRCLSYWTIEHRGLLPLWLWDYLGDWLFGCDDCQTVCPWNGKRPAAAAAPEPEPELVWPDLRSFFELSNRAFARRYAGSAFLRSGRAVLARNALVVLAGRHPEELVDLLPQALADPSAKVRATAAVAAARLGRLDEAERALAGLDESGRAYVRAALDSS